jgi:hypothetical protein
MRLEGFRMHKNVIYVDLHMFHKDGLSEYHIYHLLECSGRVH